MDMCEPGRERSVAGEREENSRRTQNVARYKTEGGDRRAGEQNGAAKISKKTRCCFCEWRVRMVRQVNAESSLRDQLDHDVKHGRDRERDVDRARDRARGILDLAARNERHFDADESED